MEDTGVGGRRPVAPGLAGAGTHGAGGAARAQRVAGADGVHGMSAVLPQRAAAGGARRPAAARGLFFLVRDPAQRPDQDAGVRGRTPEPPEPGAGQGAAPHRQVLRRGARAARRTRRARRLPRLGVLARPYGAGRRHGHAGCDGAELFAGQHGAAGPETQRRPLEPHRAGHAPVRDAGHGRRVCLHRPGVHGAAQDHRRRRRGADLHLQGRV